MFLGTATLSTLHIGISGGSHEIKKVILQHTVGRLQNLFPFCVQHRIAIFIENGFGFPFLTAADLCDRFFYRSPEEFILAPLRPQDLLFHHRDINHMEVVVIHILAQGFGHCPVALIGVHHSGEDILLTAYNLHGGFVSISIKLFCKFIAAVIVEVPIELDGGKVNKDFVQQIVQTLGLDDRLDALPNQLSGGQQQRVAIARALAAAPAIILADEPTGNLDSKTSQDVLSLLKVTSQKFAQTIVMITHNEEIAQMADRIIRIEDGRIVSQN